MFLCSAWKVQKTFFFGWNQCCSLILLLISDISFSLKHFPSKCSFFSYCVVCHRWLFEFYFFLVFFITNVPNETTNKIIKTEHSGGRKKQRNKQGRQRKEKRKNAFSRRIHFLYVGAATFFILKFTFQGFCVYTLCYTLCVRSERKKKDDEQQWTTSTSYNRKLYNFFSFFCSYRCFDFSSNEYFSRRNVSFFVVVLVSSLHWIEFNEHRVYFSNSNFNGFIFYRHAFVWVCAPRVVRKWKKNRRKTFIQIKIQLEFFFSSTWLFCIRFFLFH